jgi:hypothetical protein
LFGPAKKLRAMVDNPEKETPLPLAILIIGLDLTKADCLNF